MKSFAELQFIGTGSSAGVPVMTCNCRICHSKDPKNQRFRTSAVVQLGSKRLLIDAGPDIRQQVIRFDIPVIDALFVTHTHYDHVAGMEELRTFNFRKEAPIPCYLSAESMEAIKKLFYYHFIRRENSNYTAQFDYTVLDKPAGVDHILGQEVSYFSYTQGGMGVLGLKIGGLAYVTDIKEYDESIFDYLRNVEVLVVSAQRFGRSSIQFSFDEAISFIERVAPKRAYLTHLSHEIEHQHAESLLPPEIRIAYDGLKTSFSV